MKTKSIYKVREFKGTINWWAEQLEVSPKTISGYCLTNVCTVEQGIEHYIQKYLDKRKQEKDILPHPIRVHLFTYNEQTKTLWQWLRDTYSSMQLRLVQANRFARYLKLYYKRDMTCIDKLSDYEIEHLLFTKDKLYDIRQTYLTEIKEIEVVNNE